MTCYVGNGAVICTGTGSWRVTKALCPWCCVPGDEPVRHIETPVFGGWCGYDLICGSCGQAWSTDEEQRQKMDEDDRDENVARVAAIPDPKCWHCHDTGDKADPGNPTLEEPDPCPCGASRG